MGENVVFKKTKLIIIALSILLVASLLLLLRFSITFDKSFKSQKNTELKLIADNLASDHEGAIYGIRQFLITSGYLVEQSIADKKACENILQRISIMYPYFLNVGIADKNGDVVCSGVDLTEKINLEEDTDFQKAKSENVFAVSGYRMSKITGRPSVRFLQPIIQNGNFGGVLFVSFAIEWLNGFSPSFELPSGITVTKFDENGVVFMRYPSPLVWSGTDQGESTFFKTIQEKREGFLLSKGLDGVERMYYFRPIYHDGDIHAFIAIGSKVSKFGHFFNF